MGFNSAFKGLILFQPYHGDVRFRAYLCTPADSITPTFIIYSVAI